MGYIEVAILLTIAVVVIAWRTNILQNLVGTAHARAQAARDRAEVERVAAATERAVLEQAIRKAREE